MAVNHAKFYRARNVLVIALLSVLIQDSVAYTPPKAKVEPLYPQGLRISVPDEHGITLVAFHVNINEDFFGLDAGMIARDIVKPRNGRWTYQDKTTSLRKDDVIYYWVHVVYNGLGYNLINQEHRVSDFFHADGSKHEQPNVPGTDSCEHLSGTWIVTPDGQRKQACQNAVIFQDDFDELSFTKWTPTEKFPGAPDDEFVIYRNSGDNLAIKDGKLEITPIILDSVFGAGFSRRGSILLSGCTGKNNTVECERTAHGAQILPPIMSARMNTKGKFAFLYGRIEIRAKLPRGDWIYPLVSLESISNDDAHQSYCEIRIASSNGNRDLVTETGGDIGGRLLWAGGLESTLLPSGRLGRTNRTLLPYRYSASLWSDNYHIFELEWKSNRLTAKVDGVEYGDQELSQPFNMPYYLNLGLGVGGHTEFPDRVVSGGYPKPWRNPGSKALLDFYSAQDMWSNTWSPGETSLKVDYIKVRAL